MKNQIIHRLAKDPRVRHLSNGSAPGTETQTKIMKLTVKDGADFSRRVALLDALHMDILNAKLYYRMPRVDLVAGRFEVSPGFEGAFEEMASLHGFNVSQELEA